jgi:riboflavin kinase / FMN adenylyltransferase
MELIINKTDHLPESLRALRQPSVLIGNFDGCHLGHQKLVDHAKISADGESPLVAMSFDPHPEQFFGRRSETEQIFTNELKGRALEELGVDLFILQTFDQAFAALGKDDFLDRFIVPLRPKSITVGSDFKFGSNRDGSFADLDEVISSWSGKVTVVPTVLDQGNTPIHSTQVRQKLADSGVMPELTAMLGHPYVLTGQSIRGLGVGKQIGIPTINILPSRQLIPKHGVYAGFITKYEKISEISVIKPNYRELYFAAINIGVRPTLKQELGLSVEAHVIEDRPLPPFEAGQKFVFHLIERVRSEEQFKTLEALKQQIQRDIITCKDVLQRCRMQS